MGINREHKDRLFKVVFQEKKDLLQLYNAVNNTNYTNPEDLTINTLEDALYMGMKNDLSFIIDDILNLYEHQSTWNPNMPLRGMFYITNLYKGIVGQNADIFSSELIKLPLPKYIVFYNGTERSEEKINLSIKDAFEHAQSENPCLDFTATVLNINLGHNKELMDKCKKLHEYAQLISLIRQYTNNGIFSIDEAVDHAVDDCIQGGILTDLLEKNRMEVTELILSEYDEEKHIANEKRISERKGEYLKLISQIRKKISKNLSPEDCAELLEEDLKLVAHIYRIINENVSWDDSAIYEQLQKELTFPRRYKVSV